MCKKAAEDFSGRDRDGQQGVHDPGGGGGGLCLRLYDRRAADALGSARDAAVWNRRAGKNVRVSRSPPCRSYANIMRTRIAAYTEEHPEYDPCGSAALGRYGILQRGEEALGDVCRAYPDRYEVELIPGISSVVCLAARLKTTWEDGERWSACTDRRRTSYRR